jgi:pyruvate/2-oxoglutarate dehydrogenase complex dihydrolipoamide dehydrogenase (E3) component
MGSRMAEKGNWLYRLALRQHMNAQKKEGRLDWRTDTVVKEIKSNGVIVTDKSGREEFIEADNVLLAVGLRSRKELAHSFYGITPNTALVGDCERVAKVIEATNNGYFIGANI